VTVPTRAPDLRSLILDRESFAVLSPLALIGPASYPVAVRRPVGLATPLLSAILSRSSPCGSLGSSRPTSQRTSTSKSVFMLGTPRKASRWARLLVLQPAETRPAGTRRQPLQRGEFCQPCLTSKSRALQQRLHRRILGPLGALGPHEREQNVLGADVPVSQRIRRGRLGRGAFRDKTLE